MMSEPILVGDIGGTNTRLALARLNGNHISVDGFETFSSSDTDSFEGIIQTYLSHQNLQLKTAAFAVAGSIRNGQVRLTNRDWEFSDRVLEKRFGLEKVVLHNDFSAMARSVPLMEDDSFLSIYESGHSDSSASILVAGAGTGFGMSVILPTCSPPYILVTEGGHQAYAPVTTFECDILQYLRKSHEFVSLELLCSGSGMDIVHEAICTYHGTSYQKLPPYVIRERAVAGDVVCQSVCELRAGIIMGALGDMALATGALGGIILAGGVSERLIDYIRAPKAFERFFNRGVRSDYVKRISIRLLNNHQAPLYGVAALYWDHS